MRKMANSGNIPWWRTSWSRATVAHCVFVQCYHAWDHWAKCALANQHSQNMAEKCCMSHGNMKDLKSKLDCWETPWRHLSFLSFFPQFFGLDQNSSLFVATKVHPTAACRQVAATIPFNLALLCSKKILKIHQGTKKMVVFKSSVLEKDIFLSQSLCVLTCNYLHVSCMQF